MTASTPPTAAGLPGPSGPAHTPDEAHRRPQATPAPAEVDPPGLALSGPVGLVFADGTVADVPEHLRARFVYLGRNVLRRGRQQG